MKERNQRSQIEQLLDFITGVRGHKVDVVNRQLVFRAPSGHTMPDVSVAQFCVLSEETHSAVTAGQSALALSPDQQVGGSASQQKAPQSIESIQGGLRESLIETAGFDNLACR